MSEQKLKPCPFCGSDASMETGIVQGLQRSMISCTRCPVLMSPHRDKEQLVKAWNERAGEQDE
ncbi:Lar family restriction alleviation protein [Alteromonas macleodii]